MKLAHLLVLWQGDKPQQLASHTYQGGHRNTRCNSGTRSGSGDKTEVVWWWMTARLLFCAKLGCLSVLAEITSIAGQLPIWTLRRCSKSLLRNCQHTELEFAFRNLLNNMQLLFQQQSYYVTKHTEFQYITQLLNRSGAPSHLSPDPPLQTGSPTWWHQWFKVAVWSRLQSC